MSTNNTADIAHQNSEEKGSNMSPQLELFDACFLIYVANLK
jgi:hypothetical protein